MPNNGICKQLPNPGLERLEVSTARKDTVCTMPSSIYSIPGKLRTPKTNLLISAAPLRVLPKKILWLCLKMSEYRSTLGECRSKVSGCRLKASGSRSKVSGLRSEVSGLRSKVSGSRSKVSGPRSEVSGSRSKVSGPRSKAIKGTVEISIRVFFNITY